MLIAHTKIIVLKKVNSLKEFEFHFETRQEYIKAGNEKRVYDEKMEKDRKEAEANKANSSNGVNDPLRTFQETKKALLGKNNTPTEEEIEMSRENAKFLKPEQTNQTSQLINPNAARQKAPTVNMPSRNNSFMNNPFMNNRF